MKVKYNNLTAVPIYGASSCKICCFYDLNRRPCIRDIFTNLGPCIYKTKYYQRILKSDVFEL